MNTSKKLAGLIAIWLGLFGIQSAAQNAPPASGKIEMGNFVITYDRSGITGLAHPRDPYGAQFLAAGRRLSPLIKYRVPEGDWFDAYRGATKLAVSLETGTLTYTDDVEGTVLNTYQMFKTDGTILDWTVEVSTRMNIGVEIGDLAATIPWRFPAGENPEDIFEKSWTKHHFIAGHGSFLYFVRPNGEPPYLVVTVHPGTKFEYSASEGRSAYRAFVHSALTGGSEKRGTWRQAHTSLKLGPAGAPDSRARVGFRFQWAKSYDEIRDILFKEGLFDIRIVPGMTVPEDLTAQIALRTKAKIESLRPEFPGQTKITDLYPKMVRYLDAAGYLERAYQTARAYFIYPYEVLPWYETYKWGCYNELVILNLIDALDKEGRPEKAAWLRAEWEKKVKYFVYDDKYPFRSEYALDRTAFESSYALAKYGATHEMKPDEKLWFDKAKDRWLTHPAVKREDSRAFMDRQHRAGLAVRGRLETAYYLLGADFTASSDSGSLSYMANMGGWSVLDYGLNFAPVPYDWLQLGYASYLSSWALMNTGRPETNYGFWFPGKENDGATGWQFMTAKWGRAWIRKEVPRGAWPYDGEIDLGYGAGLRIAATILTRDPTFDWLAYGGSLTVGPQALSVVPRDGLRRRFYAVFDDGKGLKKLKIELDRDGFAAKQAVVIDKAMKKLAFLMENRTGDAHTTGLWLSLPAGAKWTVLQDGRKLTFQKTTSWDYPTYVPLRAVRGNSKIEIVRP